MELTVLTLLVKEQNKSHIKINDSGVIMNTEDYFIFQDKKVSIKIRGVFYEGNYLGDMWVMGRTWGVASPCSLEYSYKFSTLCGLVDFYKSQWEQRLIGNKEDSSLIAVRKLYENWRKEHHDQ